MLETITAVTNPAVKRLKALLEAKGRKAENAFLVEGEVMIREALGSGLNPKEALFENESKLIDELNGVPTRLCSRRVLEAVCDTVTPQGAVCAFELPKQTLMPADARLMLALDGVQDPGNLGTILRTADAFCVPVALLDGCADPYNHKTVRASMGAVFRCPVWQCDAQEMHELLMRSDLPLYGAALREDTMDARDVDYTRAALAIGSEGRGLTEEVLALCDKTIRIPMSERCESLNAAIAATVLLWEVYR